MGGWWGREIRKKVRKEFGARSTRACTCLHEILKVAGTGWGRVAADDLNTYNHRSCERKKLLEIHYFVLIYIVHLLNMACCACALPAPSTHSIGLDFAE